MGNGSWPIEGLGHRAVPQGGLVTKYCKVILEHDSVEYSQTKALHDARLHFMTTLCSLDPRPESVARCRTGLRSVANGYDPFWRFMPRTQSVHQKSSARQSWKQAQQSQEKRTPKQRNKEAGPGQGRPARKTSNSSRRTARKARRCIQERHQHEQGREELLLEEL